jgi:hypothetical protein
LNRRSEDEFLANFTISNSTNSIPSNVYQIIENIVKKYGQSCDHITSVDSSASLLKKWASEGSEPFHGARSVRWQNCSVSCTLCTCIFSSPRVVAVQQALPGKTVPEAEEGCGAAAVEAEVQQDRTSSLEYSWVAGPAV